MSFTITLPATVTLDVDSEHDANWRLARYFGLRADGATDGDPEFETLGIEFAAVTVVDNNPPPPPEPDAPVDGTTHDITAGTADVTTEPSVDVAPATPTQEA